MSVSARTLEDARLERRTDRSGRATGAVVVGGDYQGLAIVRSLGRHGIPLVVVDDERSIGRFSKYVSCAVRVENLLDEDETVEALEAVGRRLELEDWVLYATRDETVAAMSRHRDRLSEHYRVPAPAWSVVEQAWDKRETYRVAQEIGVPVPRSYLVRDEADIDSLEIDFPVALKPAIKERFLYSTKAKAWKAETRAELHDRFRAAAAVIGEEEIIVQELIPGGGTDQFAFCAFFKDGAPVASMTANRRRQHPPEFGRASTYVETVEAPEVEELACRFLSAIDYYGLVECEFKRDSRTGDFKLLDVNARTWGYHSLGRAAGVDFPYLLYRDQVGEYVRHGRRARVGVRWMRAATDLPTSLLEIGRRRLRVRDYLRSVWDCDTEAVFSWSDPLPSLVELALIPYLAVKRGF